MTETFIFMGFIWVVGFLIACGMHHENCEAISEPVRWFHYPALFIFWPDFIGRHLAA